MRGAPPVRRGDDPAPLGQLLLERNVIEITADRDLPIGIGADIALHQHVGTARGPDGIVGCLYFGIGWLRQPLRPRRFEQSVVPEVRRDDLGYRAAQLCGGSSIGLGRHVGIGGKGGDRDAEILPFVLVRNRTCQPAIGRTRCRRDGRGRIGRDVLCNGRSSAGKRQQESQREGSVCQETGGH